MARQSGVPANDAPPNPSRRRGLLGALGGIGSLGATTLLGCGGSSDSASSSGTLSLDSGTDVSIFDLGNTGWTYYDLTASLATGKALTAFTIYGSSAAATRVDDVVLVSSVTAVPEPASALLMLAGGVVLMRRRLCARGA